MLCLWVSAHNDYMPTRLFCSLLYDRLFFDVVHCRNCFSLVAFETFSASRCRYVRLGTSQILQPEFIMEREREKWLQWMITHN